MTAASGASVDAGGARALPDPVESVLFDLDGTLLDTAADFAAVLDMLCNEAGRATGPSAGRLHQTVSNGARAMVTLALGLHETDTDFAHWHRRLLTLYGTQVGSSLARLYPGMDTVLEILESQGIPWGVVTNKPLDFTRALLAQRGLTERCAVLVCPEHVRHTKPDPEPLLLACRQLRCRPDHSVYIGDHPRDVEAGHAAGLYTAVATWGYLPTEPALAAWGADAMLHRADDLARWFTILNEQDHS